MTEHDDIRAAKALLGGADPLNGAGDALSSLTAAVRADVAERRGRAAGAAPAGEASSTVPTEGAIDSYDAPHGPYSEPALSPVVRLPPGRRRRRGPSAVRSVLGAAAAAALVVGGAVVLGGGGGNEDVTASDASAGGYLVPADVPEGLTVASAADSTAEADSTGARMVVYGARNEDGTLGPSLAVFHAEDSTSWLPGTIGSDEVRVASTDLGDFSVRRGNAVPIDLVAPAAADAPVVAVAGHGVSVDSLLSVAQSLVEDDPPAANALERALLPEGFRLLYDGHDPAVAPPGSHATGVSLDANGDGEVLVESFSGRAGLAAWNFLNPGASAARAGARSVIVSDDRDTGRITMVWAERPGLIGSATGFGVDLRTMVALVSGLQEVSADDWSSYQDRFEATDQQETATTVPTDSSGN